MPAPTREPTRPGRDLRAAVVVGVALLAALVGALAGPPWLLAAVVLVLLGAGLVETGGVMAGAGRPVDVDVLVVVAAAAVAGALLADERGLLVAVALLPVAALLRGVLRGGGDGVLDRVGRTVLLGAWVVGLGAHAVLLRGGDGGATAVLAVVGVVAVADTAAYAVGSRLGRRPLAPRISPNKTVEGVVAGVVAAGLLGAVALPAVALLGDPLRAAAFAVLVAAAGVLGDLAESMLKRDLGVKDLGRALPGHGGVLDRVDALLLALPVGYHLLALLA